MNPRPTDPGRRTLLAAGLTSAALAGLPAFTASAAPVRPTGSDSPSPADAARHRLWWQAPADDHSMIEQGLPVGNGRLGALAGNDPGRELLLITDATMLRDGRPTSVRLHSTGGRTTTVAHGGTSRTVALRPGESVTLKGLTR